MKLWKVSMGFVVALGTSALQLSTGCTTGVNVLDDWKCTGDGGPYPCKPCVDDQPCPDAGSDAESDAQGASAAACQGECVEMGAADFRREAVLMWTGEPADEPTCPDRAPEVFYTGYADPIVWMQCDKCECGPSQCALPDGMTVHNQQFCQDGNPNSYSGPAGWDGSCVSPSVFPGGSFSSIKLAPAKAMPCEPIVSPIPPPPAFLPGPVSFGSGLYWSKIAKACQGVAKGECDNPGELCLPNSEPPPPEFRQCVQYLLPVNEAKLPQCPSKFPDRVLFYSGAEGKLECSPCECGEPIGAQCDTEFSAYQDTMCTGSPMSLFENVPSSSAACVDFGASSFALGSMSAQWKQNVPGECEPKGGELINETVGADPRVFCCQ